MYIRKYEKMFIFFILILISISIIFLWYQPSLLIFSCSVIFTIIHDLSLGDLLKGACSTYPEAEGNETLSDPAAENWFQPFTCGDLFSQIKLQVE